MEDVQFRLLELAKLESEISVHTNTLESCVTFLMDWCSDL